MGNIVRNIVRDSSLRPNRTNHVIMAGDVVVVYLVEGPQRKLHKLLNNDLIKICKEYPLSLFCYQTSFLRANGCGDLANLRPRVISCVAEHLIRYVVYIVVYIHYDYPSLTFLPSIYIFCLGLKFNSKTCQIWFSHSCITHIRL
jgi:hypothetical protein